MENVLVTYDIPKKGINNLKKYFDVDINPDNKPLSKKYLLENISDYYGVITMLFDQIGEDILDATKGNTEVIANYAVGYDNIDLQAAQENDITICNTPGVLTNATAELAFALMINITRKLLPADQYVRKGHFEGWRPKLFLGNELRNKTIGIFGMGRIGQSFAAKCQGFGTNLIYHNRSRLNPEIEKEYDAEYVSFPELIETSDIISIHAPLTEQTRHTFDRNVFEQMKEGIYIINTGRGAIINEKDLAKYLENGQIEAAGLDVYEYEPHVTEELKNMDNVVLLPHIGSASKYARESMSEMASKAIIDVHKGREPANKVV